MMLICFELFFYTDISIDLQQLIYLDKRDQELNKAMQDYS